MSLVDQVWGHVKASQQDRITLAPPRATNIWEDLTKLQGLTHAQSLEIGDLREAVNYLADVVESLQTRLDRLEREKQ